MTLVAGLVLRSTIVLLAGLGAAAALRGRSASLRHFVLATALVAAALVGPLGLALPGWELPSPSEARPSAQSAAAAVTTDVQALARARGPVRATIDVRPLVILWGLGTALMAMALGVGMLRVRRIGRSARPLHEDSRWLRLARERAHECDARRPVSILLSSAPVCLGTWGSIRPRIVLPAGADGWSDARIHAVLCHELAHVRRHDWLVQLAAEIVRAVFWFNPLAWIAAARLRRESERACDDCVLRSGIPAADYASELTDLARLARGATRPAPVMAMARSSSLHGRIAAMLNPAIDRRPLTRAAVVWTIAALVGVTAPVAALRPTQDSPMPLTGAVYDPTGAALPEVAITLSADGHDPLHATTDGSGRFTLPAVAPGDYVLQASLAGFRPLTYDLTLQHARDWNQAITLQVGVVSETISVQASRMAAPASAPSGSPTRIKVGGNIRAPRKVHDVQPRYPQSMREAGQEGIVTMEAVIGRDGSVTSVGVLSGHVHPDLALAAVDAVRQWRFQPTLLNGAPVEVAMTVAVAFTLSP